MDHCQLHAITYLHLIYIYIRYIYIYIYIYYLKIVKLKKNGKLDITSNNEKNDSSN